jgi:rhodanese-related sulfurtransferase
LTRSIRRRSFPRRFLPRRSAWWHTALADGTHVVGLPAVAGTIDIPLGQLEARAGEIPTGKPVLVFCRSGNRSQEGAAILAAKGYDASSVEGGIIAWQDAGLPTA